MKFGFLAMAASALLWVAPVLADEPRTVPIRMSDTGHILADVTVNGAGPYTFIIDTAAGGTVVFDDFAAQAALQDITGDNVIQVQGASGVVEARLVSVGEVQMADWVFLLDRAVALPTPSHMHGVDGVLGTNVLFGQPLGFALGEGELQIYDEDVAISPSDTFDGDWFFVPIAHQSPHDPFYWLTLVVDGVAIEAVMDTGARRTTINPAGARVLGINPDTAALTQDEPVRGATDTETPAWVLPVATVQLGQRIWGGRHLTLADLSIFERMGRAGTPTIVLGADFLAEQNFIIDPVDGLLWMKQRQSAALGFLLRPATELGSAVH